ncbi:MAG TPA: ABC transporter permease [Spirochaetales bacterium]|nr:ABC transporter permease [Spirochaetales bacterium]HRY56179.1 ABC transporter permease [Spirochaetia bacterium]HRZ66231.1 ABC transporter permease [Spirochaetia bacterium]
MLKTLRKALSSSAGRAALEFLLVLALGMAFNADGAFFKLGTHRDTLRQASVYGILACGMTMVVITGGIDLSVGSILGVSAVSFSILTMHMDWPWPAAVLACVLLGAALGGVSGGLVARAKLQPFIATLAMQYFARGLAKYITGGKKISTYVTAKSGEVVIKELPSIFKDIDSRILWGNLSIVSVIFFVCIAVAWVFLARHKWGRELYSVGGNEEAARLSGVPVRMTKFLAYAFAGIMCAVAGIAQAAQETQGDPEAGKDYEVIAIAMVVIGGTSLSGGRGSMGLTLLGILTIGYLQKILSINAVPEAWRLMVTGVIVVLAVLTQRRRAK